MNATLLTLALVVAAAAPVGADKADLKDQALDAGRPLRERLAAIAALSRLESPCPAACVKAAAVELLEVAREAAWRSKRQDWARDIVVEEAAAAAARVLASEPEFEPETLVADALEDTELPDTSRDRAMARAREARRP